MPWSYSLPDARFPGFTADAKERYPMSKRNGDKSKFNRERRHKIARRVTSRALRASWAAKAETPPPAVPPAGE